MANVDLWKYCTPEQTQTFLCELRLLGDTGWPPEKEIACLYAVSNRMESHYREIHIPKQDGSTRVLHAPDALLGRIQTNLLHRVLDGRTVSPHATAYRKGMGIRNNAAAHLGTPLLLKLDICAFFDSIPFAMISRCAFPILYYPPAVRTLLTHLCCYRETLPQGAPTSAAISNLVMKPFDDHMAMWCGRRGIAYTRYCDDMAFSGDFSPAEVERKVEGFLHAMGFALNHRKTKLLTQHQRQCVTGIVVNDKLQVPRAYRRRLRQEVYHCIRHGVASHLQHTGKELSPAAYRTSLLGRIQHVLSVNPQDVWFRWAKAEIEKLSVSV